MSNRYVDAFKALGATLKNTQWSFSVLAADGSVVVSYWKNFFVPSSEHGMKDVLRYSDRLQRVLNNSHGHAEIRRLLELAWAEKRPIGLVIARPGDVKAVVDEHPASDPGNCFAARPDLVGELSHFDGDTFVIDFRKRS